MATYHSGNPQATSAFAEQEDLKNVNGQETVLESLDNAKLSWFHIKAILVAGMGFFTDAYDLFNIGLVTKLIAMIYYSGNLPLGVNLAISGVALCGTLTGQLFFGWMGDHFGRKFSYGLTLFIMIIASICSGLSFGRTPKAVVTTLCFWRFILGLGIGGDYPLSATIMSEYANRANRGALVASVFAMQGLGYITAATVTIIVSSGFKRMSQSPENADYVWRTVLMFGAVPTALTVYARSTLPETARYTLNVAHNVEKVEADMAVVTGTHHTAASYNTIKFKKFVWTNKAIFSLLGCGLAWFLVDVAFYSQGLFQSNIYTAIGWVPNIQIYWPQMSVDYIEGTYAQTCSTGHILNNVLLPASVVGKANCASSQYMCTNNAKTCWMTPLDQTYLLARAQAIISLASVIPGYWFTVFTIEKMGRWTIQVMGFFFMTVFMAFLAGYYNYFLAHVNGFITMYAFTFFFANWGPNATTFIFPVEVFPSSIRSTAHGICAAMGKSGAIMGAFGFLYASQDPHSPATIATYGKPIGVGIQKALGILAAVNFTGLLVTLFMVPYIPLNTSLEEVSGEIEHDDEKVMA